MAPLVTYERDGAIAIIAMDDGKVNALSLSMLDQLNSAFDLAVADGAVVIFTGRAGIFSAGFDLSVLRGGGPDVIPMLQAGFALAERVLSFPTPVVIACPGHAIAMGVFLLLCGDYRMGVSGPYKFTANEVAIGLTMPRAAVEICRQRLAPAYFNRAVILAEPFSPQDAVTAGFLDQVVEQSDLQNVARQTAAQLETLDKSAHMATKLRARGAALHALRRAIEADDAELLAPR
jgi:enoyl-CoA hydratase